MPALGGDETSACARQGQDRTVIVVGSGLAGLATAVGMARMLGDSESHDDGHKEDGDAAGRVVLPTLPEVVEKKPVYNLRGAAFGLAPNGLKALRELCPEVAQTLVDEGVYMPHTGGYLLPWFRVREALLNYAQSLSGKGFGSALIRFRMGWTLDRIEQVEGHCGEAEDSTGDGPDAVRAYFANGEALTGSLLIGADGIHSKVRELLDLPPALQPPASRVWRGHVRVPEDSILYKHISNGEIMPLGSIAHGQTLAGVFSFHAKTPGAAAWTVMTKDPGIDRTTSVFHVLKSFFDPSSDEDGASSPKDPESKEELFLELLRLTPEADLSNVYDNTVVPVPDEDGSGWGGKGCVVLVGDSAHAMRPASGLGGSMSFEDAQLLCRKLKPWMLGETETNRSQTLPDSLRDFENERLVRVRRIWHMEWQISESAYKKPGNPSPAPDEDYKAWLYAGI
jgi:2-polyprenyl-6-methoxyphenol hydroxylase-like FAD-dependent oxidoreductase